MQTILDFFKKVFSKAYLPFTLSVIILLLIVSNFQTCSSLSSEKKQHDLDNKLSKENIKALTDTLTDKFNKKIGAVVTEKTSYLLKTVNDLSEYNKDLYNQMKGVKNSVAGIDSKVNIITPTLVSELNKVETDPKDSTKFSIPWSFPYVDEGFTQTLKGKTNFKILGNKPIQPITSLIDTNKIDIRLKYNFIEKDGTYVVSAYSLSPIIKFTELNGALVLDKMPSKTVKVSPWSFGPYGGFGLNTDILGGNPRFGWTVGIGVGYNIFGGSKKVK